MAALMFMWYRKDVIQHKDDCNRREDQLLEVVKANTISSEKLCMSIQSLSESLKHTESERIKQIQLLLEQSLKR